jgi:hypothetical protein
VDDPSAERESRRGAFILLVIFLAVVSAGIWLVYTLDERRKIDDCITSGRRDCVPVDLQGR